VLTLETTNVKDKIEKCESEKLVKIFVVLSSRGFGKVANCTAKGMLHESTSFKPFWDGLKIG